MSVHYLARPQLNTAAWDHCVASAPNNLVYGYSWYLDAVTALPGWKWAGLFMTGHSDSYLAVMPVPLRRKFGIWVVHQPFFCQMLGVFGPAVTPAVVDAFVRALLSRYSYGSVFQLEADMLQHAFRPPLASLQTSFTHLLRLAPPYEQLYRNYRSDTRRNLRQAITAGWVVEKSTDVNPLLTLFRQQHAHSIPGGVAPGAYALFKTLFDVLQARGCVTLLYASRAGQAEAGAVFVHSGNRIIYLFNAASGQGRNGHARTLLINELIRKHAESKAIFDFESPPRRSIAQFYEGFGAQKAPYVLVRWDRFPLLTKFRRLFQSAKLLDVHIE